MKGVKMFQIKEGKGQTDLSLDWTLQAPNFRLD